MIAILSNGPMADLTFDKVAVTLLAEERRLAQAESSPGASTKAEAAYFAANGSSGRVRKVNNNRPRHPPCDECGMTNHPTAKCYKVIGYPEGHPLHSSAPPSSSTKNATAALAHAWLGTVVDNDAAAPGPTMPAIPPNAAIAQASSSTGVAQLNGNSVKGNDWLLDSGASMHLCHTRQWFADFTPITGKSVVLADGGVIPVLGRGRIDVDITIAGRPSHNTLNDVLYVPGIAANLLSVAKMTEAGLRLSFHGRHCVIRSKQGAVIARAEKQDNRLYRISARTRSTGERRPTSEPNMVLGVAAAAADSKGAVVPVTANLNNCSAKLAHQRMGHLNFKSLQQIQSQNLATDIPWTSVTLEHQASVCDSCQMGNHIGLLCHTLPHGVLHSPWNSFTRTFADQCTPPPFAINRHISLPSSTTIRTSQLCTLFVIRARPSSASWPIKPTRRTPQASAFAAAFRRWR